jgi:hypothetical protein
VVMMRTASLGGGQAVPDGVGEVLGADLGHALSYASTT